MIARNLRRAAVAVGALVVLLTGTAGTATASGGIVYGPEWRKIVNAETGFCVDIRQQDGPDVPGSRAQQWNCTGVDEQHWLPTPVPGLSNIFTFTEGRNHLCLDVHLASGDPGTVLQQWPCNGTAAQQWEIRSTNEIVSQVNFQCMDTTSRNKGTVIMQWPCNGNLAQRWVLKKF